MNFLHLLPSVLFASGLLAAGPSIRGGGSLVIQGTRYRFQPTSALLLPPTRGLGRSLHLDGGLTPDSGGAAFRMSLVLLLKQGIYRLDLHRPGPGGYPDSLGATMATQIKVVSLQDRPGGQVHLECSGPLNGILGKRPVSTQWSGRIWATLPQEPGNDGPDPVAK